MSKTWNAAAGSEDAPTELTLLRGVVEASPHALLVVDAEGGIRLANRRAEALFKLQASAFARTRVEALLPAFWQARRTWMAAGGHDNEASEHLLEGSTANGRTFPVAVQLTFLRGADAASQPWVACHIHDVSERMAAEEALRRSEASFRTLIEETPEGVAVQRDGRLVYVNAALLDMLGYDDAYELLGRPLLDLVHEDEHDQLAERARPTIGPGPPETWECRFLHRKGFALVGEMVALRLVFDGEPAIVLLVRDVTERKQLQTQIVLTDRMATVGTLAAGIAHEINNPLAYIVANLAILREQLDGNPGSTTPPDDTLEILDEVTTGVERVRDIVRDLKTFSRTDDDEITACDVHPILDSAIGMASNEIRHRSRLVKEYGVDLPRVRGNGGRLGQVFLNMLINAAQSIPDGQATHNEIRVRTYAAEDDHIGIEIRDTGIGIAPQHIGRIFEPFYTTRPVGRGTGLGLSICHAIVTALHGHIRCESVEGYGTTFWVELPTSQNIRSVHPPPSSDKRRRTRPQRRARLLVVDDDTFVLRALNRALRDHEVVSLSDGMQALDHLHFDRDFDLILCDLMMPSVGGADIYETVRECWPGLEQRMVFMSGGAFSDRALQFIESVPNPRLDKPFDIGHLQERVQLLIEELRQRRSVPPPPRP